MGALTRTAIGIINKTKRKTKKDREGKKSEENGEKDKNEDENDGFLKTQK
jgi:hypothetical protein